MVVYCNNVILADKICIANSFMKRLLGLMGKKSLGYGEGLLLLNSPCIHCFFMRMPIDAIYLSKDLEVLGIETLRPWNIGRYLKKTVHVLELREGAAVNINVGDTIVFRMKEKEKVICHDR